MPQQVQDITRQGPSDAVELRRLLRVYKAAADERFMAVLAADEAADALRRLPAAARTASKGNVVRIGKRPRSAADMEATRLSQVAARRLRREFRAWEQLLAHPATSPEGILVKLELYLDDGDGLEEQARQLANRSGFDAYVLKRVLCLELLALKNRAAGTTADRQVSASAN